MEKEIWKDIKGYEGLYQISNYGRVKSLAKNSFNSYNGVHKLKEKIKKCTIRSCGYRAVALFKNGKSKQFWIHRLVAEAFIPNPNNYKVVNHLDGGRLNNHVSNLEWCTYSHNTKYAVDIGAFDKLTKKVKVIETGEIYRSTRECARQLNIRCQRISDCLNGKSDNYRGFHFELAE